MATDQELIEVLATMRKRYPDWRLGQLVANVRERVFRDAAAALGREDLDAFLQDMGRSIGPPWQARHKLAAAAAIAHTETRAAAGM